MGRSSQQGPRPSLPCHGCISNSRASPFLPWPGKIKHFCPHSSTSPTAPCSGLLVTWGLWVSKPSRGRTQWSSRAAAATTAVLLQELRSGALGWRNKVCAAMRDTSGLPAAPQRILCSLSIAGLRSAPRLPPTAGFTLWWKPRWLKRWSESHPNYWQGNANVLLVPLALGNEPFCMMRSLTPGQGENCWMPAHAPKSDK